jgi:hypothetical protein
MKFQRGLSLSGFLLGAIVIALLALLGMKVAPAWIEYGKIVKVVKATANDSNLRDASVAQVREAFDKRADIDVIESVKGDDLEIDKGDGRLEIRFAYTRKVHLFGNASLVFDFEGGSTK